MKTLEKYTFNDLVQGVLSAFPYLQEKYKEYDLCVEITPRPQFISVQISCEDQKAVEDDVENSVLMFLEYDEARDSVVDCRSDCRNNIAVEFIKLVLNHGVKNNKSLSSGDFVLDDEPFTTYL